MGAEKTINKLLSARFLVTVILTLVFAYITIEGKVPIEVFIGIYSSVVTYYFMKQRKENDEKNNA